MVSIAVVLRVRSGRDRTQRVRRSRHDHEQLTAMVRAAHH